MEKPGRRKAEGRELGPGEDVIPVVLGRTQALDFRIGGDHRCSHLITGGICVKAAVDGGRLGEKSRQPARIGPGSGCGDTAEARVESKAADGVDGRLDQNDVCPLDRGDREEAQIFLGARGQAMPGLGCGASQFSSDGVVFLSKEQEDGIGPAVGIEVAGLSEGLGQSRRNAPLSDQVALDAPELGWIWQR